MKQTLTLDKLKDFASTVMMPGSKVWLFGSRARGDAKTGSDWDLLVLLDKDSVDKSDYENYAYSFVEFGCEYEQEMSPLLYTLNDWELRKVTPFYQNVEHDKKVIYGA
ncbi:MAG: nucleotidyltransferase domain-containing protein [Bacteroidales bacterium]|nr:nucleotidyltransferase domain-containing protein [Bacteroidales bacterium]